MTIVRRYIDGPSGQIHLAEAGRGPSVLLLHQTPRSWDEFREVMVALEERLHLIAMDLPGMGSSDQHPDGPSIENYAAAAAAVIEQSGRSPVSVCGHHTGGVVAVELAARYPHLVERLVLSSTPWIDVTERARRAGKQPIDTVEPRPDGSHLLDLWNQRAPFYGGSTDQLTRLVSDALRADDPAAGHRAVGRYRMENSRQAGPLSRDARRTQRRSFRQPAHSSPADAFERVASRGHPERHGAPGSDRARLRRGLAIHGASVTPHPAPGLEPRPTG